jgi:hypothetical protein
MIAPLGNFQQREANLGQSFLFYFLSYIVRLQFQGENRRLGPYFDLAKSMRRRGNSLSLSCSHSKSLSQAKYLFFFSITLWVLNRVRARSLLELWLTSYKWRDYYMGLKLRHGLGLRAEREINFGYLLITQLRKGSC